MSFENLKLRPERRPILGSIALHTPFPETAYRNASPLHTFLEYRACTIQQIDVSFLCVCPLIDDKLRHNIVKVAVGQRAIMTQTLSIAFFAC